MRYRAHKTTGLTLIEMTLVIGTIALLVGFAVPAVRVLVRSFQSEGGVRSMVGAALNSARTMAMSRQRYVGVRFQKLCTSDNPADPLAGLLEAPQYVIFIMHDPDAQGAGLANGFRAVEGMDPIKLPDTIGVMDLSGITNDAALDEPFELSDATTFSIVFAPSGRLVVHNVRVRNKEGINRPLTALVPPSPSYDDVFNVADTICRSRRGMFIQDDYPRGDSLQALGLGEEPSRTSFVVYEVAALRGAYGRGTAWTEYLSRLAGKALQVNLYTGNLIAPD
jgi:hypothetical protein